MTTTKNNQIHYGMIIQRGRRTAYILLALIGFAVTNGFSTAPRTKGKVSSWRGIHNIQGQPASTLMNINNIAMWVADNGSMERRPQDGNAGTTFPRGTSTFVYAGGLIWGGVVEDGGAPKLRVGGQTYNYGTVPGRIVSKGVRESESRPDVRIYRIRRDWKTADLSRDAAEFFDKPLSQVTSGDIATIRNQYRQDWIEWPAQKGAPYYDRNKNDRYDPDPTGTFDPTQDEPGLGGADQVIWFVANDLDPSATRTLYGSPPIGMEMQITLWGYARADELGNVIYQRYRIIYKGTSTSPPNARIDSMYLCKWVDPDEGDYGDDYAGCVYEKSLGYVYNSSPSDAEYIKFKLSGGEKGGPPVVGYDFFQGPRVKSSGSTARWDFQIINDYTNLPMTTFGYFAAGGHDSDPDLSNYEGTKQWYNLLRAYRPRPVDPPQCFNDPTIQQCTHFALSGDPTTLRGWIDGRIDPPSDRRILLSSGPISMVLGDTQEVVVGLIGAIGKDNIDGIDVLKQTDDVAQDAFNLNFQLPDKVPSPSLRIVELSNKLILDWESDTAQMRKIEEYNSKGYRFETYNIYQFPDAVATAAQAKSLPPFDVTQPRSLALTKDKIRSRPFVNGQQYYFAVTAVVYNPDPALVKKRLESPILIQIARPHSPNPGTVYPYVEDTEFRDVQNTTGTNDAGVHLTYFDPTRPDGHTYLIPFTKVGTGFKWDFIDQGTSASPRNDTMLYHRDLGYSTRYSERGFTLAVNSPPVGIKGVFEVKQNNEDTRNFVFSTPDPQGAFLVLGRVDQAGNSTLDSIKGLNISDRDVELRFFAGESCWALMRRATASTSRWVRVPYTAWQIKKNSSQQDRQIYTVITGQSQDSLWRPAQLLSRSYRGHPLKTFYPLTINVDTSIYAQYHDDIITRPNRNSVAYILWSQSAPPLLSAAVGGAYIADLDGDGNAAPPGTVIRFEKYKVIEEGDLKTVYVKPFKLDNVVAAQDAVSKINVFPNPYYGVNRAELSRFRRYVTFNHLPASAKIRIFNLAGVLVRTLIKADEQSSLNGFLNWDLQNEEHLPVASGMYIAYIELYGINPITKIDANGRPHTVYTEISGTKTLKLMIVQEQQFLDNY